MDGEEMNQKAFYAWLEAQGAEVFAPTSGWEFARFRAREAVHIIYRNKDGAYTAHGFAAECMDAFTKRGNIAMGYAGKRKTPSQSVKASLRSRDGNECFFCGQEMTPETMSIEHLVGRAKGGPNHMDNLVLSHAACNQEAGNLPLIAKIRIYHRNRGGK